MPVHQVNNPFYNLSTIYRDMNQYSTALEYAQKAVAIIQHLFPNGHPDLDTAKQNLEEIRKAAGSREQGAVGKQGKKKQRNGKTKKRRR